MWARVVPNILPASTVSVVWDESPCPLCRSTASDTLLESNDPTPGPGMPSMVFAVVKCRECGLSYTNPRPDAESIGAFYPADYRPHRRARKIRHTNKFSFRQWLFGMARPEGRGDLPWPGPGKLLDFGCGAGSFLKRMADRGWTVVGLDASVGAVKSVQDDHGLQALVGTLPHPDLLPGTFDVVTMWHSLEHVHDPLEILKEAHALLKPGGKLVIAVPNIESWAFKMFGTSWFALDLPRHLTHFSPKTLQDICAASGFQVESLRVIRHSDWLRHSARLAAARNTINPFARLLMWKPAAKVLAWMAHLVNQSDCLLCVAQRPA